MEPRDVGPARERVLAAKVMRIATREETEELDAPEPGKDPAAAAMGR